MGDSVLGPLALLDQDSDDQSSDEDKNKDKSDEDVDTSFKLINTSPVNQDETIDEPITSGGDVVIGDGPGGGN